jgi:transcriptional regulator with XRE-family HTH domain
MTTRTPAPLRSGGFLWGPERVRLGVSLNELHRRTGIAKGMLSLYENGRMVPNAGEYERVMAALREAPDASL